MGQGDREAPAARWQRCHAPAPPPRLPALPLPSCHVPGRAQTSARTRAWRGRTWWPGGPGPRCPTGTPAPSRVRWGQAAGTARIEAEVRQQTRCVTSGCSAMRSGKTRLQQAVHSSRPPPGSAFTEPPHQAVGGGGQGDLLALLLLKRQVHAAAVAGRQQGCKTCVAAQLSKKPCYACMPRLAPPSKTTDLPAQPIQRTRCSAGLQERGAHRVRLSVLSAAWEQLLGRTAQGQGRGAAVADRRPAGLCAYQCRRCRRSAGWPP